MTPTVQVFTAPSCVGCRGTKRWLEQRAVDYMELDVTLMPAMAEGLRDRGHSTLPVVRVNYSDGTHVEWAGYKPSELETVLGGAR